MRAVLFGVLISLTASILGTPIAIRYFQRVKMGQEIREEGPKSHQAKRGTPTMGGTAIIAATVAGYFGAHLFVIGSEDSGPTASALLVLFLFVGMGLLGFMDDFIKLFRKRNLGLNKTAKLVGQLLFSLAFAMLALQFENEDGLTPASTSVSFTRDLAWLSLGTIGFVVFAYLLIAATSNAVNLTDGLDGLAAGAMAMVLAGYVIITFWQFGERCTHAGAQPVGACYEVRDPLDLALLAACGMGACFGFLWWNASPARIFMGDTGSLALGGLIAGLAVTTRTELLLIILGGLFVVETLSVIFQVAAFRGLGRRVFNMAPIHHHFELQGWAEMTTIVRFWICAGISVAVGMGIFYGEFIRQVS